MTPFVSRLDYLHRVWCQSLVRGMTDPYGTILRLMLKVPFSGTRQMGILTDNECQTHDSST